MPRVQAIVVLRDRVLMVKHRHNGVEWWVLPGGAQEDDELPWQGALREFKEECNVDGVVVRPIAWASAVDGAQSYSFLVDIGDQNPSLGLDPEVAEGKQVPVLVDVQWLRLADIPERDRAFLWAAGLLSVDEFLLEVENWGDDPGYPSHA